METKCFIQFIYSPFEQLGPERLQLCQTWIDLEIFNSRDNQSELCSFLSICFF